MGLPTLHTLFPALMTQPAAEELDLVRVHKALENLYPHFKTGAANPSFPPFEEFLGLVVAAEETPPVHSAFWKDAHRSAVRLLSDFLWRRTLEAEASELM